jgi:hypothetical protein
MDENSSGKKEKIDIKTSFNEYEEKNKTPY